MADVKEAAAGVEKLAVSEGAPAAEAEPVSAGKAAEALLGLTVEERFELIRSIAETTEEVNEAGEKVIKYECMKESELRNLLEKKPAFDIRCYDGFEPSGRMHIAQGLMKANNVNKLTKAGCTFVFWVADWFAMLNDKFGGDLKKIRVVGEYFIEVWKACGMDMSHVEFLWSSDEINARANEYWTLVMDVACRNSIARVKRCATIMGKAEGDSQPASQIFYPTMQCADIFFLKADICQLGLDQRKVNMLAREYAEKKKRRNKPIIVSHHMLSGLLEGHAKMSKSNPNSAIFMEDTRQDVNSKIKKAFCPEGIIEGNPLMDYLKHIVFPRQGTFFVARTDANGGDVTYATYEEAEAAFAARKLHPKDLKQALANCLNDMLEPVRQHFQSKEPIPGSNFSPKTLLARVKQIQKQAAKAKAKAAKAKAAPAPAQA